MPNFSLYETATIINHNSNIHILIDKQSSQKKKNLKKGKNNYPDIKKKKNINLYPKPKAFKLMKMSLNI